MFVSLRMLDHTKVYKQTHPRDTQETRQTGGGFCMWTCASMGAREQGMLALQRDLAWLLPFPAMVEISPMI